MFRLTEEIPPFILAGSGLPNTRHLVTTFTRKECDGNPVTMELNGQLQRARQSVRNAFGTLKGRFEILRSPLQNVKPDLSQAVQLITACCVLHNFLLDVTDDSGDWFQGEEYGSNVVSGEFVDDRTEYPQIGSEETTRDSLLKYKYTFERRNERNHSNIVR